MTVPNILAVDDAPANLTLLSGILKERGYRVRPVPSGALALAASHAEPPDLVLLDIHMPEMDGFEVIARLKAEPALREIPVIFLTAHTDVQEKVKAFELGAVDYVTKPFHAAEVQARVATHLALQRQQRELRGSYDQLSELERLRDSLVHMIVHDLRSPLTAIASLVDLMLEDVEAGKAPAREDVVDCRASAQKMIRMISTMLDVSKLEAGAMKINRTPCDLAKITAEVVAELRPLATDRVIELAPATAEVPVVADPALLGRVIQNLVSNALRFSPNGGTVRITLESGSGGVRVAVSDDGCGVPESQRRRIFEKFGALDTTARATGYSTGLGLPFCRMAIEAHGGTIGVEGRDGRTGSTFWFTLPPG